MTLDVHIYNFIIILKMIRSHTSSIISSVIIEVLIDYTIFAVRGFGNPKYGLIGSRIIIVKSKWHNFQLNHLNAMYNLTVNWEKVGIRG